MVDYGLKGKGELLKHQTKTLHEIIKTPFVFACNGFLWSYRGESSPKKIL